MKVILNCTSMSKLRESNTIRTKLPLHGCDAKENYLNLGDLQEIK